MSDSELAVSGEVFVLLGTNIGMVDDPTVRAECAAGLIDFSVEEALARIDQFDEAGRRRILAALQIFGRNLGENGAR